jgi:uncharacterized repeat protein (TIGR02059 family)
MKNTLIVIFLSISSLVSAATYYIDPSGKNTNTGSISSPWNTLAYACSKVKTVGDIIHVNAGTYYENSRCSVSPGVSIEGVGNNSIINTSYNAGERDGTIALLSLAGAPINGNQSISYIRINCGSNTGTTAISVEFRNNVSIHHVTIENSNYYGIWYFNNTNGWLRAPTIHATGNKVYDCTFINSEHRFEGQSGFLYYNNIHDNSQIDLKCLTSDWMKGWKVYNNTFSKAYSATGWNFIFETWHFSAECEIYNNVFNGEFSLDLSDIRKGSGTYGLKVYNNQFIRDAVGKVNNCYTLNIEGWGAIQYLYIYNNYFKNVSSPISIGSYNQGSCVYPNGTNWALDHIYIYYNIVENSGATDSDIPSFFWFWEAALSGYSLNQLYDEIYICNNTWVSIANSYRNQYGMYIDISRPATNFHIDNNIITGCEGYAMVFTEGSNFNTISIQKNIFYKNGSNTVYYSSAPGNLTISNLTSDPLLTSLTDYHLQAGSPAINAGLYLTNLPTSTDYDGNAIDNPPEIGAYEYNLSQIPVYQSSVIENASPNILEMTYSLKLANIVPVNSSFNVKVNSTSRTVSSVAISENKIKLTLSSSVVFGDLVTISYTKPAANLLKSASGGEAANISDKSVTNNCKEPVKLNDPPVVIIKSLAEGFSGFVYEIDASGSSDPNNDKLIFDWKFPDNISFSTSTGSKTRFLAPSVNIAQNLEFILYVSDGIVTISKSTLINIKPYKPELNIAQIKKIDAKSYQSGNNPNNVKDGNLSTIWSSVGDNQWLLFSFSAPFNVRHLEIAFFQGQNYSSYFDIYASKDNISWDPVLINASSCNFSGDMQVFDFPASYSDKTYSYLKYIGHGSSLNTLNIISEFKILGIAQQNPNSENAVIKVTIYPNPAIDNINISIDASSIKPDCVKIIDNSGKIHLTKVLNPNINFVQLPINLNSGLYLILFESGNQIISAQKLIVI